MNKEEYFVNKYLEELKSLKESEKEEWLTKFFLRFENIKNKYEAISSNLPLDAAELIGEFREKIHCKLAKRYGKVPYRTINVCSI